MAGWRQLLEAATVALDLPGDHGGGTGFVLAPGTVVTCAHVVRGASGIRGRVVATGQELPLTLSDEDIHHASSGLDLAFLRYDAEAATPGRVLASPRSSPGDSVSVYGHPRGDFRAGQWAVLEYLGDSRPGLDDPIALPRVYGTPVGEGFSGSPVVSHRTGAVCGMLVRSNKAGSAHMVPLSEILARCPLPPPPAAWLDTLTDDQLRAGGFRHPGPELRDYLTAARNGADEHPYAALLTDVGDIPLSSVYVRQEASRSGEEDPGQRPAPKRIGAEDVLASDRHVLFTGSAGSGKSSLLRRLTFNAASAWLADPAQAPPYIPVRITAGQLLGRPLPLALAEAAGRDLPGLRRSPRAEFFESAPMPSVDWLVCVDGLDEVLDPDDRGRVIRTIQGWENEPCLRFAVATRALVASDMDRLRMLRRYALLGFGDLEIAEVARAWFTALKLPGAEQRAQELTTDLRHGRLDEAARNPLYLTMICVVAAVAELPRNPAELYRQFVRILRDKGQQRLARADSQVRGITPDLLNSVHDILRPVAAARQSGDARPLLEQAVELLALQTPGPAPSTALVSRALTFTGLVAQRGGALHFPHHTIQEYLAGCAIADRLTPKDPEALSTVREAIAAEQPHIVLFIASRWSEQGHSLAEFLRTVVNGGGWRDLLLCATILSDGLVIDEELTRRFTRAVIKLHGYSVSVGDIDGPAVLARLYTTLDTPGLATVVRDRSIPHVPRSDALAHYVRRGGEHAATLAAELADEPDFPASLRVDAAALLFDAGESGAARVRLTALAHDCDHLSETRMKAATVLLAADQTAGTKVLCDVCTDIDFPLYQLEPAWTSIHTHADPAARAALAEALDTNPVVVAGDTHHRRTLRCRLLGPDRPQLVDDLRRDPDVPAHLRDQAGWDLPQRVTNDPDPVDEALYHDILCDPHAHDAALIVAVSHSHHADLTEQAARNEQLSVHIRVAAAARLVELGCPDSAAECGEAIAAATGDHWSLPSLAEVFVSLGRAERGHGMLRVDLENSALNTYARLRGLGLLLTAVPPDSLIAPLTGIATDTGIAAEERLSAVERLQDLDPKAANPLLTALAHDADLPGDVRHRATVGILNSGARDTASGLLMRIAEDPRVGTAERIRALVSLAEIAIRAATETLHRMLDEPGLLDEQLWRLLELADALTPDTPLRERLHTMLHDESLPAPSFLEIEHLRLLRRTDILPLVRRRLRAIADDDRTSPRTRARAVMRSLGLMPYPDWKARMASAGSGPLHGLSLHAEFGGMGISGIYGGVGEKLFLYVEPDFTGIPTGALQGLDPHAALAEWFDLVEQRSSEAVTGLRSMSSLIVESRDRARLEGLLLAWAADPAADLPARTATVCVAQEVGTQPWHALAGDESSPPELRVAICEHLPASGAYNRVPLARALATDVGHPVDVRAKAAALLAEDLGAEGRELLRDLSGPHTPDPEAHLAAARAWAELDLGGEAVAAYLRLLEGERGTPRHRVDAAGELTKWPAVRRRAVRELKAVLGDRAARTPVRIDAAERLTSVAETAEAHLGLLRMATEPQTTDDARARIGSLLPADLRGWAAPSPGGEDRTSDQVSRARPDPEGRS
ncbi:trypsin-like peptidase domain-containing protein [Streptomyces sp. NPDC050507]|uniref:trypsin-like peptidase domain-containing protein n=1 Tax=Streptomyces sp. NPDC050507 TaxID=3365619 RepID=UPI0037A8E8A4